MAQQDAKAAFAGQTIFVCKLIKRLDQYFSEQEVLGLVKLRNLTCFANDFNQLNRLHKTVKKFGFYAFTGDCTSILKRIK
ncbi:MAG: hypothetical protein WAT19_07445 [Ferruginibacter sp.]